jgi:hypothetical protein
MKLSILILFAFASLAGGQTPAEREFDAAETRAAKRATAMYPDSVIDGTPLYKAIRAKTVHRHSR